MTFIENILYIGFKTMQLKKKVYNNQLLLTLINFMEPQEVFFKKKCSQKFRIHRKTPGAGVFL